MSAAETKETVKEKYGQIALHVVNGGKGCCGSTPTCGRNDPITSRLYTSDETADLSSDKDRVLTEAFRVLKPGGRLAVSDVVVRGEIPAAIRRSVELWIGCVAGALEEREYRDKLARAGFEAIDLEPTRIYRTEDA